MKNFFKKSEKNIGIVRGSWGGISYHDIYRTLSKKKHIIFVLDVENKMIKDKALMKEIMGTTFDEAVENAELAEAEIYYKEFNSYREGFDYMTEHYTGNDEVRLRHKEAHVVIEFYSKGTFQGDNN